MPPIDIHIPCPDRATAEAIAQALLERRLVACANIGGRMASLYRWNGKRSSGPRGGAVAPRPGSELFEVVAEAGGGAASLRPAGDPACCRGGRGHRRLFQLDPVRNRRPGVRPGAPCAKGPCPCSTISASGSSDLARALASTTAGAAHLARVAGFGGDADLPTGAGYGRDGKPAFDLGRRPGLWPSMSPSSPPTALRSTRVTRPWRPGGATTAPPASDRTTIRATTPPSPSIPTTTISRPSHHSG